MEQASRSVIGHAINVLLNEKISPADKKNLTKLLVRIIEITDSIKLSTEDLEYSLRAVMVYKKIWNLDLSSVPKDSKAAYQRMLTLIANAELEINQELAKQRPVAKKAPAGVDALPKKAKKRKPAAGNRE